MRHTAILGLAVAAALIPTGMALAATTAPAPVVHRAPVTTTTVATTVPAPVPASVPTPVPAPAPAVTTASAPVPAVTPTPAPAPVAPVVAPAPPAPAPTPGPTETHPYVWTTGPTKGGDPGGVQPAPTMPLTPAQPASTRIQAPVTTTIPECEVVNGSQVLYGGTCSTPMVLMYQARGFTIEPFTAKVTTGAP